MLDPYMTWAKFTDGGFSSYNKVAWCQVSARLDTDHLVDLYKVRRIYRMVNSSAELKDRMVVFTNEKGNIARLDPANLNLSLNHRKSNCGGTTGQQSQDLSTIYR